MAATLTSPVEASAAGRKHRLGWRHRVALVVAPAVAATLAAVGAALVTRDAAPIASEPVLRLDDVGRRDGAAPAFELPALAQGATPVTLDSLRGTPFVLNFFSSTCVPCRTELPLLQEAAERWAGRVAVVGIDHLDRREAALQLVADTGVRFPVGFDPRGETAVRYEVPALPATFFVAADGTIEERVLGPLTRSQLERRVAALASAHRDGDHT